MRRWLLFVVGAVLILAGSFLAHAIQTTNGVTVTEVRIPAGKGVMVSGLLYTPPGLDAGHPAPAVLVSHGYINTREMQSPFAIELSRRGFVVLAMDMTGHGYSGGNVGALGFGGPAALAWLRSLPIVDAANVGLEGHSMGAGAVLSAAASQPQGYRSMVLEGTTAGLFGPPIQGSPIWPRNLALVFGQYDEFAGLMWQQSRGSAVNQSARMRQLFGVSFPVVVGKVYGEATVGTARVLYNPPVTHPWEHFSRAGVGHAVDWFQATLKGARSPANPAAQIWIWKEVGTLVAFAGFVVLLLGVFRLLLSVPLFAPAARAGEAVALDRGASWRLAFGLTAVIPAASFFLFMGLGGIFRPQALFPQYVQNQLLVWAMLNAGITVILGMVLRAGRPTLTIDWLRSVGLAAATMAVGYLSLVAVDAVFKTDYRFWVLGLKPLDAAHLPLFLAYLPLWCAFFLVSQQALVATLPVKGEGELAQLAFAALAMGGGFAVLMGIEYASLFVRGLLLTPKDPLTVIIAIPFVPLLAVVGVISAFTWRRTNSHVPGALMCAVLVCWYVTASTATHWSATFPPPALGAPPPPAK